MLINENIRPYLIINGVNSRNIQGLIISKLPPICKPPKRYRAEQIDGRDGEIITELGWSSYDKTFEIGLSYDYNVDDIIAFFNEGGEIIFSNEPDKKYNYQLFKEINFEKLINFKKAKVTLRVEPFKFSDSESERTFEGDPLSSIYIRNNGNIFSRPFITITGVGECSLKLNNKKILGLDYGSAGDTFYIDPVNMDALTEDGYLANRQISGNYDNIKLKTGENKISFTGTITEFKISNYSRWI